FTWTASPVIPVRPTTSTTSAGMLSSSAIVSPRPSDASRLLHRAKLAGQVVEHRLRLARVQDRDGGRRLPEAHRDPELLLAGDVGIGHALFLAKEGHVGEDLFRLNVLCHDDELGLAAFDELRDLVRPLAHLPAFLRQLAGLIRLVDHVLRHLETNLHLPGQPGDLRPPGRLRLTVDEWIRTRRLVAAILAVGLVAVLFALPQPVTAAAQGLGASVPTSPSAGARSASPPSPTQSGESSVGAILVFVNGTGSPSYSFRGHSPAVPLPVNAPLVW